jgi:hypothetical protein
VSIDGAVVDDVTGHRAAVALVQRVLDEAAVSQQNDFAVVHSGVVAHGGRAILLPGPTSTGKSTLVAELVRRGAAYCSDEYALLDAEGRVHPYPRPLLLRDGSGDRPVLASSLGGVVATEPIAAGVVLALRRTAGATLSLTPLSQSDGVLLLLKNTPQPLVERPWIVAPIERAIEGATCYVGLRGEAGETAEAILDRAASLCDRAPRAV